MYSGVGDLETHLYTVQLVLGYVHPYPYRRSFKRKQRQF